MKLEEVRCNIGNKVKRKENGLVISGDMIIHSFKEDNGKVFVNIRYHEKSTCHMVVDAKDIELSEKPMKNYKIRVTPETSAEVQELLFELGCTWASGQVNSQHTTMPYLYMYSKIITHGDDGSHFNELGNQEITLPELRDMVVLKRNDVDDATHTDNITHNYKYYVGANVYTWEESGWHKSDLTIETIENGGISLRLDAQITWQDAYIAMANGQKVQVWIADGDRWETINHHDNWSIAELAQERIRLEPPSITLEARAYTKEELLKIAGEME